MANKKNTKVRDMKPRKDAKGGGGGKSHSTQGAGLTPDPGGKGGNITPIKNQEA